MMFLCNHKHRCMWSPAVFQISWGGGGGGGGGIDLVLGLQNPDGKKSSCPSNTVIVIVHSQVAA